VSLRVGCGPSNHWALKESRTSLPCLPSGTITQYNTTAAETMCTSYYSEETHSPTTHEGRSKDRAFWNALLGWWVHQRSEAKQSTSPCYILTFPFTPTPQHRPFPVQQQTCVSSLWGLHWPARPLPWLSWRPPSPLAEVRSS